MLVPFEEHTQVPTSAIDTSIIATRVYVDTELADVDSVPLADDVGEIQPNGATADVGNSSNAAPADHVHPHAPSAVQNLTGPDAISLTSKTTRFSPTALNDDCTLADGLYVGQEKYLYAFSSYSAGVRSTKITPANFVDGDFISFVTEKEWARLEWQTGGWILTAMSPSLSIS